MGGIRTAPPHFLPRPFGYISRYTIAMRHKRTARYSCGKSIHCHGIACWWSRCKM